MPYSIQKYAPPYTIYHKELRYFTQKKPIEQKIIQDVAFHMEQYKPPCNGILGDRLIKLFKDANFPINLSEESILVPIKYSYLFTTCKSFISKFTIESGKFIPKTILPGMWANFIMDLLIRNATKGVTSAIYRQHVIRTFQKYYENPKPHKTLTALPKVDQGSINDESTGWEALPLQVIWSITTRILPEEFANPKIFINIYEDVKGCAKSVGDKFKDDNFSICIAEKAWLEWVSKKAYESLGRFARNHNMIDKDISPYEISYINVVPIAEAMLIAASYGLELDQYKVPTFYSREICSHTARITRRIIPGSISRASLNQQDHDCEHQTKSERMFELVYNRALMLATLSRVYVSGRSKEIENCEFSAPISIPYFTDEYALNVDEWLGYFIRG